MAENIFTKDLGREILTKMCLTRAFEEKVAALFSRALIHGTTHLSVGEEGSAIGATAALEPQDLITSTHRGHGHCIGKGIDINRMMAELLGKEDGYCRGKGGSMHIADVERGNLGANGVVGGGLTIATGAALTVKMKGQDRIVLCFLGDGALNQGPFHESVNLAAVWKLPVIFFCENNTYGMSMHVSRSIPFPDLADRAAGYGIPGRSIDGNDVFAVYAAVKEARRYARTTGPLLLVANTYRTRGHSKSDANRYRTKEEIASWEARCPIRRCRERLLAEGTLSGEEIEAIDRDAAAAVEAAVSYAERSPLPGLETVEDDVYAPGRPPMSVREITYADAIREAMSEEMRADPDVYLMGEDVGVYGGAFGVSLGMIDEFGPDRVRDTPISESVIIGAAVGSAVTGMRPIAEIQFSDFILLGMDQLVNQGAKIRYMFGGKAQVPMVLRSPEGSGTGAAAQHSQSLEALFCHIPGLLVVAPSTPYDAKGLLKSAIRDNSIVLFFEQKLLYRTKGPVPAEDYTVPLGKADVKRQGTDATIITYGRMVQASLEAAGRLSAEGIETEVVDLRTLRPLDREALVRSAAKTGRVLVTHEACRTGGLGGEIAAIIAESDAFYQLDAPIARLAGADVPIPYCPDLERNVVPTVDTIAESIRALLL